MSDVLPGREIATVGGGCFWCTEAVFQEVRGVDEVVSGYAGGHVDDPTYEQVCGMGTGHAEVVQVTFDPAELSYPDLLRIFFATHDPTTSNQQGNDRGPQYRSAIFTHSDEQKQQAEAVIAELADAGTFAAPIVTEVTPFSNFYPAEDYHQNYVQSNPGNPYCTFVAGPKVAKLREKFADRLKA